MRETNTSTPAHPATSIELAFEATFADYTQRLLTLLDGLFVNFEDALFESADRDADSPEAQRCFDLMRRVRTGRVGLEATFASTLRRVLRLWMAGVDWRDAEDEQHPELEAAAARLARKSQDHFTNLLEQLGGKTEAMTGREGASLDDLPFSPLHVARAFVTACETLELEPAARTTLHTLFRRFVADRLGPVLGQSNDQLVQTLRKPTRDSNLFDLGAALGNAS